MVGFLRSKTMHGHFDRRQFVIATQSVALNTNMGIAGETGYGGRMVAIGYRWYPWSFDPLKTTRPNLVAPPPGAKTRQYWHCSTIFATPFVAVFYVYHPHVTEFGTVYPVFFNQISMWMHGSPHLVVFSQVFAEFCEVGTLFGRRIMGELLGVFILGLPVFFWIIKDTIPLFFVSEDTLEFFT